MAQSVVDQSANRNDTIANASQAVGRGVVRRAVFSAIYKGGKRPKTAKEIARMTGYDEVRVLQQAKILSDNHLVTRTKVGKLLAYQKDPFYNQHKARILSLATSPVKLAKFPTKVNAGRARGSSVIFNVSVPKKLLSGASLITVDDVANFKKIRKVGPQPHNKISETRFKNGISKLLGESGTFKDWGGECRDLSSTRVLVDGKRRAAAFAFKGPGKTGKLTPGKMGKNGDQIQRLATCPAQVFFVQYWGDIEDSVLQQLETHVRLKAMYNNTEKYWYGVIDGNDSARLIVAYPAAFK